MSGSNRIYIASRASIPERAQQWRRYRDEGGVNIISSWIDQDGPGQTKSFTDLWDTIRSEIAICHRLILYAEPTDFPLKGALVEVGIALGLGRPVVVVYPWPVSGNTFKPLGSWVKSPGVHQANSVLDAIQKPLPLLPRFF